MHRAWNKVNAFRGASIADVLSSPNTQQNQLYYGALTGAVPRTPPSWIS
jgi:Fe(3+) dicitrate transport protein